MLWLEITVQTPPQAVEGVSELLGRYTSDGIVIDEPIELLDEGQDYRVRVDEPVLIHAYLPADGKEEALLQRMQEELWHLSRLSGHAVGELQMKTIDEEDWANAWKEHFHVTHIGQRIVIRPSWREYTARPDEIVLTLDPGMAFGTGLHQTTRMCLEQLERHLRPNMRVLDVGTGSGILALAAAKLGAESVYALDNSSVATESALANSALNGQTKRIQVVLGELDEAEAARMVGQYDLVIVNIFAHVIGALAPQLVRVLAPDGLLIASGIIEARLHDALDPLLAAGVDVVEKQMIDDWIALVLRKRE